MNLLSKFKIKLLITAWVAYLFADFFVDYSPLFFFKPVYIVALPALMIMTTLCIINPKTLLITVLFTRALLDNLLAGSRLNLGGFNTGVGGVINFIMILYALAYFFSETKLADRVVLKKFWFLFLLVCGTSLFHSPEKSDAIKFMLNLVTYLAIFTIPFFLINRLEDFKFWCKLLIASTFLPALIAFADLARGGRYFSDAMAGMRIAGTFDHPNVLAFYLLFCIVLVFYFVKNTSFNLSRPQKLFCFFYIMGLCVLLLATKTRSAWIAFWLFFVVYGILKEKKYLILMIFLPPVALLHPVILERVVDLFHNTEGTAETGLNSFAWRQDLLRRSLEEIRAHWLFGQGLNSFRPLSKVFFPVGKVGVQPHNTFLQVMFETGAIGLVSFSLLLFAFMRRFFVELNSKIDGGLSAAVGLASVLGYAAICSSDNMLYYLSYNWYFWFFIAMLLRKYQLDGGPS